MPLHQVVGGADKELGPIYQVVGGADKELLTIYQVVAGVDKEIYSATITQDITLPASRFINNVDAAWWLYDRGRPAISSDFSAAGTSAYLRIPPVLQ